jgi:hypothetical protein
MGRDEVNAREGFFAKVRSVPGHGGSAPPLKTAGVGVDGEGFGGDPGGGVFDDDLSGVAEIAVASRGGLQNPPSFSMLRCDTSTKGTPIWVRPPIELWKR